MASLYRVRARDHQTLVWVLVDGRPHHVSDYAALAPRRRPAARCPECGGALILKLGRARRHHAAHRPDQICSATHPETALHVNCKLALARVLSDAAGSAATLSIIRRCAGPPLGAPERCSETASSVWAKAWDRVEVEHKLGGDWQADILLLRDGTPVAAIEIVVSNPVSAEKARALDDLSVPWIEIAATEGRASPAAWRLDEPLAVLRHGGVAAWRCHLHASPLRAARVVDIYHPGGSRDRFIYRITEVEHEDEGVRLRLQRGAREVALVSGPDAAERRSAVRAAFAADVQGLTGDDGSFSDSPMRWATGDAAENIVEGAVFDMVGRDPTPLATTFPRRWFFDPAPGQWFLPREMRGVRWDRAPLDVFAAHPAWHASRSRVRERAVPEDSWGSPIFAARPIAAMFGHGYSPRTVEDGLVVIDLRPGRRAIVVVERAVSAAPISSLARVLAAENVDAVWISHPSDWVPAMEPLAWAAAGRDARGQGAVLVDGVGAFPAIRFARALTKGDARLSAPAIRRAMAARVGRLGGGHTGI